MSLIFSIDYVFYCVRIICYNSVQKTISKFYRDNNHFHNSHLHLSSCLLPADSLISRICAMCLEPLFPAQLLLARQFDLSVTSIPQSVGRWRHNEYSWCSHPLHFIQALHTPVVKVRLVVWRSDLTGQGDNSAPSSFCSVDSCTRDIIITLL